MLEGIPLLPLASRDSFKSTRSQKKFRNDRYFSLLENFIKSILKSTFETPRFNKN